MRGTPHQQYRYSDLEVLNIVFYSTIWLEKDILRSRFETVGQLVRLVDLEGPTQTRSRWTWGCSTQNLGCQEREPRLGNHGPGSFTQESSHLLFDVLGQNNRNRIEMSACEICAAEA